MNNYTKTISHLEEKVIKDFGNEWNEFNQSGLKIEELESNFLQYFNIFPLNVILSFSVS